VAARRLVVGVPVTGHDRGDGLWPVSISLCRRSLAAEPDEPLHVIGEIGDADGAHDQRRRSLLPDKNVFDCGARSRFARIGLPRPCRHRSALRLLAVNARDQATLGQPRLVLRQAIGGRLRHRRRCCRHRPPPPASHRHGLQRGWRSTFGSARAGDRLRRGSYSRRPEPRDRPAARHPRAAWPWRTSPSNIRGPQPPAGFGGRKERLQPTELVVRRHLAGAEIPNQQAIGRPKWQSPSKKSHAVPPRASKTACQARPVIHLQTGRQTRSPRRRIISPSSLYWRSAKAA